jgi:SAM-dependent methyltransferase
MDFHGANLVCPACRTDLEQRQIELRCAACGRTFPVLLGIPDLRLWPDPYIDFDEDRAKGMRLAEECAHLSFPDAVEHYYQITSRVPPFQARRFARSLMAATARAAAQLDQWESLVKESEPGPLLEIGCGTAPLLQVATARYPSVVGVDVAFRWLVLAQKRLADAGVTVPLICADAEALPFRNARFARVVADSALEHLRDQPLALQECVRVMTGGAHLFIATPNRFSVGPDPHTGLPAGSFMPGALTRAYVRRKGGIPPIRRLLSVGELRSLLLRSGLDSVRIALPDIPAAQRAAFGGSTRALLTVYEQVRRSAPGRLLLERIGPILLAVGRKPA